MQLAPEKIQHLLGPEGPLSRVMAGFEHRRSQVEMAAAVADAFREGGELLVEAGTGTGKTLAYLIPAVLSGRRVVVSTGTKNLQEQLYYKDIPLVRKALGVPFSACLMKGRSNYLCLQRFGQFAPQPTFRFLEEAEHYDSLERWAGMTETGDRAEIPGFPENLEFWTRLSARSENCVGKECRDYDRCYVTRLRQRAAKSEIVIVNHHLLFADLMVREGDYGEVLPEYDYLVVDEAHQFEDVATHYFGAAVSSFRIEELARDAEDAWHGRPGPRRGPQEEIQALRRAGQDFFEAYRQENDRYRIGSSLEPPRRVRAYEGLRGQLEKVAGDLKGIPNPDESAVALMRRTAEILFELEMILSASDPSSVSWCERRERSVVLRSSPIHVGELIRRQLLEKKQTVVFTSATLTVDGSFEYTRN
ncbi:MAG: ATP-dependent DNA helicase, partial [Acidobacteriota bacterium]